MLDVDKPIFTQAELLKLVPKLSSKSFQNWITRGILQFEDKPGKQFKRLYPVALVVGLRFMTQALELGVKPLEAAGMTNDVMDAIDDFRRRFQIGEADDGVPKYIFEAWRFSEYRRGRMVRDQDGSFRLRSYQREGAIENLDRISEKEMVYFTVEIDILIAVTLNAVYRLLANRRS